MKSIVEKSLDMTGLFEAEVFIRLMLWRWNHPFADDEEFANGLLEDASIALREALNGKELIAGIPPAEFNFVAAIWYAEQCAAELPDAEQHVTTARKAWLTEVRRSLPSCFCDPSELPPAE